MQKFHQGSFAACILGLALPKTIVHPFSSAYLELGRCVSRLSRVFQSSHSHWPDQSLSRTSQYHLHWQQGTWAWYSATDYSAPPISLLWPDPAYLPSTKSAGSGLSSQRMQHNSWSKRWSYPAWTSATRSWLDSQPANKPGMLQCASFATSFGFLLQQASNSRWWCWPSRLSTELHPSTSKQWSDHMVQREHFDAHVTVM